MKEPVKALLRKKYTCNYQLFKSQKSALKQAFGHLSNRHL